MLAYQENCVNSAPAGMPSVYELLGQFPAGLNLDVGAANGVIALKMLKASPNSRIICYEPFAGNLSLFHQNIGNRHNVTLIPKAVSDFDGPGTLYVASVTANGYSSAGALLRGRRKASDFPQDKLYPVEVCSIGSTVSEHVRLLKIDVQGGEFGVLRGASQTIEKHGIDLMSVEFTGSRGVLDLIFDHGYVVFDAEYSSVPNPGVADMPFETTGHSRLTTGRDLRLGNPIDIPRDPAGFCGYLIDFHRRYGSLQTDLTCVHKAFLPRFMETVVPR